MISTERFCFLFVQAEVKSGYGLDLENEMKLLRVLHRAKKEGPIGLSITYCGAHAVPKYLHKYCPSAFPAAFKFIIMF